MANFYKVTSYGVSRFIKTDDVKALQRMKKDFDGKLVVDKGGKPRIFNEEDIRSLQRGNSRSSVDNLSIDSIFKEEDTVSS